MPKAVPLSCKNLLSKDPLQILWSSFHPKKSNVCSNCHQKSPKKTLLKHLLILSITAIGGCNWSQSITMIQASLLPFWDFSFNLINNFLIISHFILPYKKRDSKVNKRKILNLYPKSSHQIMPNIFLDTIRELLAWLKNINQVTSHNDWRRKIDFNHLFCTFGQNQFIFTKCWHVRKQWVLFLYYNRVCLL